MHTKPKPDPRDKEKKCDFCPKILPMEEYIKNAGVCEADQQVYFD